jgi:hypothetical protein
LQWLIATDEMNLRVFPNNGDASFKSLLEPMPAGTLLHYGAAAVKGWGRNSAVLNDRPGVPRPTKPKALPLSPTRSVGDRTKTISKLSQAWAGAGQVQPADNRDGTAPADSEQQVWDEDDVMLFGNSRVAIERHAKKERERERSINEWRKGTIL